MKVKPLEFIDEGEKEIGTSNLWMLGGNHCHIALIHHILGKQKEIKEQQKEIRRLETEEMQMVVSKVREKNINFLKMQMANLKNEVKMLNLWVMKLYNRGRYFHKV